jgi:hypothetical protein
MCVAGRLRAVAANTADVFGLFSFNALGFVVLFVRLVVPLFGVELVVRCYLVLGKKFLGWVTC